MKLASRGHRLSSREEINLFSRGNKKGGYQGGWELSEGGSGGRQGGAVLIACDRTRAPRRPSPPPPERVERSEGRDGGPPELARGAAASPDQLVTTLFSG